MTSINPIPASCALKGRGKGNKEDSYGKLYNWFQHSSSSIPESKDPFNSHWMPIKWNICPDKEEIQLQVIKTSTATLHRQPGFMNQVDTYTSTLIFQDFRCCFFWYNYNPSFTSGLIISILEWKTFPFRLHLTFYYWHTSFISSVIFNPLKHKLLGSWFHASLRLLWSSAFSRTAFPRSA